MKHFSVMPAQQRGLSAFTLVEIMLSTWTYAFVLIGVVIAIQIFSLRVYTLADTKLRATQGARQALSQIENDIRQSVAVSIGNCSSDNASSFQAVPSTNLAAGNALIVYAVTNLAAPYTLYYLETNNPGGGMASNNLMCLQVGIGSSNLLKLATYVTNSILFTGEDCQGNVLSNTTGNQVFGVTLQFCQFEYAYGSNAFNYYQARTKICRRN